MNVGIALIEASVDAETSRSWVEGQSDLVVVGCAGFGEVVRWAADAGFTHVTVTSRAATTSDARLLATVLVGALPGLAVAVAPIDTTSVALAAAASAALEGAEDPVRGLEIFTHLATTSLSGVWLSSVTRLDHPKPSVGTHLRSIFSRGFVATLAPEHAVARTLSESATDVDLLIGAGADTDAFASASALSPRGLAHSVPAIADVRAAYGSPGAEFVALARVPDPTPRTSQCPVCGIAQSGVACPFCQVHLRVPERT